MKKNTSRFTEAYKKLNKEQKRSVDTIDGPVMVIAGPGTGKTQVLSLRIANILQKTDIGASGILSLTFTRSGVTAMRKRLVEYIGNDANKVMISTFHGFAQRLVEKHYELLGFMQVPELLDETKSVSLADILLNNYDWKYLRPRANPTSYFNDIKNLISLLKRESISPEDFKEIIATEIEQLMNDPISISSRGETKGQLKKEIQVKIESLHKTAEVVDFYRTYESVKHEQSLMDYDDMLAYAVRLVTDYEDVRADIRELYQYVLVDEHQDSSGIQNAFLTAVWADTEHPNIFVVGDDRQLIYGFGGASMNHFTDFVRTFPETELITLIENYRSTTPILDLADTLLTSELAQGKLSSNHSENKNAQQVTLAEYDYSRDEIIAAGLYFKQYIEQGTPAYECAILVPKNYQVKSAVQILASLGVPASGSSTESLFATREYADLRRVFQIISNPYDAGALAESLFDSVSQIPPLTAHTFLKSLNPRYLTLDDLLSYGHDQGLFAEENPIVAFGKKLQTGIEWSSQESLSALVSKLGNIFLIDRATSHQALLRTVEAVRTLIHLALSRQDENPHESLKDFLEYLDRLEQYGTHIPVAIIGSTSGVQIMTLHGSKGLEFEHVWIAHMNQSSVMSQRRGGFTLPSILAEKVEKKDEIVARREIYVAITRAKTFCTISYARRDIKRADMELVHILAEIPDVYFIKKTIEQTTRELLEYGTNVYTKYEPNIATYSDIEQLQELVRVRYADNNLSVTLLNNFFECPWKWYFKNFLQLPDAKNASLMVGSAIHKVLETILKAKKIPNKDQVTDWVREALIDQGIDGAELQQETRDGVAAIMRFVESDMPNLSKDIRPEHPVFYRDPEFPMIQMYGKIDMTEQFPDGAVHVTDFKTGSSKTVGMIEKMTDDGRMSNYLRQLTMYSYLITGAEKGVHVAQSRLYFLEAKDSDKNRIYSIHITNEHIALLKKDITDYQQSIESGSWVSQKCHFKPFGTGVTECEYCKKARYVYNRCSNLY